jgi:hypothetical protein
MHSKVFKTEIELAMWLTKQGIDLSDYDGSGSGEADWCVSQFVLKWEHCNASTVS